MIDYKLYVSLNGRKEDPVRFRISCPTQGGPEMTDGEAEVTKPEGFKAGFLLLPEEDSDG